MTAESAPEIIRNAGELPPYPDIDYPWPIKLVVLVTLGWILLGPIYVFFAVRRGRWATGPAIYACAVAVATGAWLALAWGYPIWAAKASRFPVSEGFSHRFAIFLFQEGSMFLGFAAVLAAIAALAGHLSTRWRKRSPAR